MRTGKEPAEVNLTLACFGRVLGIVYRAIATHLIKKAGLARATVEAGARMVTQSAAREFGPQGLHVAHVIVDGAIDGDQIRKGLPELVEARGSEGLLEPEAIAEVFWQIHGQSPSAWTHEVDLRPFNEPF